MSRKRRRPLRRRRTPTDSRWTLRVHMEGEVTERQYLEELGRHYRGSVRISVGSSGQVPTSLVNEACEDADENRRRGRQRDRYDEIWCVFDRDEQREVEQSIRRARDKRVHVAFSNPCFELWIVLHHQDQTAFIERRDVQRLARNLGFTDGKRINTDAMPRLLDSYEAAKRRARELDRMHSRDGRPSRSNPSTGMWRLVDSIRRGRLGSA